MGDQFRDRDLARHDCNMAEVLAFWFKELRPEQWFKKDVALDEIVRTRFGALCERLATNLALDWRETAEGCLAAVIVLDQFPRQLFRDDARAFATDEAALAIASLAIERCFDRALSPVQRKFLYMPFQHSEDADVQARSVVLFATIDDTDTLAYARRHKEIIDRFGRFPHRNASLGRESTEEELAFLKEPKSVF